MGCGVEGGVAPNLAAAGYEPLAIDPHAPEGPWYRQITLGDLDDPGPFVAAVCGRVLHHLEPLGPALDRLAGLAPLVVVDEFAWDRIDDRAVAWYGAQFAATADPRAPDDLGAWLERNSHHLHAGETVVAALDERYERRLLETRPYLCRWLRSGHAEEERLIAAGDLPAIGWRYVGVARPT